MAKESVILQLRLAAISFVQFAEMGVGGLMVEQLIESNPVSSSDREHACGNIVNANRRGAVAEKIVVLNARARYRQVVRFAGPIDQLCWSAKGAGSHTSH
jgi:hypothetical protein